jgi:hypothetical protein
MYGACCISQANCAECGTHNIGTAIARALRKGCISGSKNDRLLRPVRLLPIINLLRTKMGAGEDLRPRAQWPRFKLPLHHAEPFTGQEASCWEKHEMEREIALMTVCAA